MRQSLLWIGLTGIVWAFSLQSPQLKNTFLKVHLYNRFGCEGINLSPELSWKDAPKETKSFALTMFDPDAPTGQGWWHWIVYDIPADVHTLPKGAGSDQGTLPAGAKEVRNDYGTIGYGGPCPPKGDRPHRYVLTLYALDVRHLGLLSGVPSWQILQAIKSHTLAKATLTIKYGRP